MILMIIVQVPLGQTKSRTYWPSSTPSCSSFNRKYVQNFYYIFQFIAGSNTVTANEHTLRGKASGIVQQICHLKALTITKLNDWLKGAGLSEEHLGLDVEVQAGDTEQGSQSRPCNRKHVLHKHCCPERTT